MLSHKTLLAVALRCGRQAVMTTAHYILGKLPLYKF